MRVCLIGATHPAHNPRLVREADSLTAAGHEVRVVAPSFMPDLGARDSRLLARRTWKLESFDFRPLGWAGRRRSFFLRGRRKVAQSVFQMFPSQWLGEHSYMLALSELSRIAARERADWFIGHAHPALPIAARAARRWGTRLGFDCEDLLSESHLELDQLAGLIETKYLRDCSYVSVPSESIGRELTRSYELAGPIVLYNFFPVSLVNGAPSPARRLPNSPLKVHWFGQVLGPERGIEDAIEALGLLGGKAELHLRGNWASGYAEPTLAMAERHHVKIVTHPLVDHDKVIGTLAEFDIGLALERPAHGNYSRTLTNKIGSYLLAGLAIAATDTPGQREILERIPEAGFLYPAGDAKVLAEGLRKWIVDPKSLGAAKQAAWDRARQSFCWDVESRKFFAALGLDGNGTETSAGREEFPRS